MDREDVQAEIEVFPEPSLLNFEAQVLVGGGNDAHVDGNEAVALAQLGDFEAGKGGLGDQTDLLIANAEGVGAVLVDGDFNVGRPCRVEVGGHAVDLRAAAYCDVEKGRPLALIGFMASGKSSVGRLAAERLGMPFVFRCGRLMLLVLDSRGERDVFRKDFPILGERQWQFIDDVFAHLPPDVDALGRHAGQSDDDHDLALVLEDVDRRLPRRLRRPVGLRPREELHGRP